MLQSLIKKAFLVKPVHVALQDDHPSSAKLERNLTLFDLICIGVGGTVGSGIFVLTGLIAHEYSGPSVIFSSIIAGIACSASAVAYAELSCLVPSAGSSYVYVYIGLGELPAFITGFCLTLEYGLSGAAVAGSWGLKFESLVASWIYPESDNVSSVFGGVNVIGGILQFLVMLLLFRGTLVSKLFVNFLTIVKLLLVSFIILAGFTLFKSSHIQVWMPFGFKGVLHGSAASFFGYLGYDEVCCLAGEAINPQVNLPRAVMGTILIITVIYVLAAAVLVGMVPYSTIDSTNGFGMAFEWNGWGWAHQLVSVGEVLTLPLVVLVSFLAQPRLQYALAMDGLLPAIFAEVDENKNLRKGILISGITLTVITMFVPLSYLDDMICAGVLLSYNLTNTSLIILRYHKYHPPSASGVYRSDGSRNNSGTSLLEMTSIVTDKENGMVINRKIKSKSVRNNNRRIDNYELSNAIPRGESQSYDAKIDPRGSNSSNFANDEDDIRGDNIRILESSESFRMNDYTSSSSSSSAAQSQESRNASESTNLKSVLSHQNITTLSIYLAIFHMLTIIVCSIIASMPFDKPTNPVSIVFIILIGCILLYLSLIVRGHLFGYDMRIRQRIYSTVLDFINVLRKGHPIRYNPVLSSSTHNPSPIKSPEQNNSTLNGQSQMKIIDQTYNIILNAEDRGDDDHHNNVSNSRHDAREVDTLPSSKSSHSEDLFEVPCMPFIPLLGIVINYYLIVQLSWLGLMILFVVVILSISIYFLYSIHHSIGNTLGWSRPKDSVEDIPSHDEQ